MKTLTKEMMSKIQGGMTTAELIAAAWNACPAGGSLTVTNQGDGSFAGTRTYSCGSMDNIVIVDSIVGYAPLC